MKEKKVAFPSFEVDGKWFLPENPNHVVEGNLKFSPYEYPILELSDDLINEVPAESFQEQFNRDFSSFKVPIILGKIYNGETIGEEITLYKCSVLPKRFSTGLLKIKCPPAYILRGFHFYTEEEIKFNNLCFHFTHLETWLSIKNSAIHFIPDQKQAIRYEEIQVNYYPLPFIPLCNIDNFLLGIEDRSIYSISYENIEYISILKDKLFELNSSGSIPFWQIYFLKLMVESETYSLMKYAYFRLVCSHSSEPQELDKYIENIFKIQDFLVFAMGQATNLTEVSTILKIRDTQEKSPTYFEEGEIIFQNSYCSVRKLSNNETMKKEIEKEVRVKIYFKQFKSDDISTEFKYDNVLFYFYDIEHNFNDVFAKWYSNFERLETGLNLYLGLFYIPKRYLRERFLSLAQSIEAFHRIIYGGRYIEEEDYINGLYNDFVAVIDSKKQEYKLHDDFTSSIKITLRHHYQYSLRKRLKELIREHEDCLPEFFKGKENRNNFAERITNIRNNLTHLDENRPLEITPQELSKLSHKLEALLRCCIMNFLEIDQEIIKKRIE